jgi:hypothetical protein
MAERESEHLGHELYSTTDRDTCTFCISKRPRATRLTRVFPSDQRFLAIL